MNKLLSLSLVTLLAGAAATVDAAPRDGDWRDGRGRHGQSHGNHDRHQGRDQGRHDYRDDRRRGHSQGYRDDRKHYGNDGRRAYRQDNRHWNNDRHWNNNGYRPSHHGHHGHRYRAPAYYARPHGYRAHRWASGHYLPRHYYGPSYYVDYRPYQLAPPPYGYHWVRVDNDVLLVALATGLIADTVYGLFY